MRIRLALLVVLILSVAPIVPSFAADRYALVIGNAKYPDAEAPLKEPINDARDVADELKRDGFTVDVGENLTGDATRRALDKFYARIRPGSVALIFFSGFGVQSQSNRQSYMIPVDAQIWTEPDVRRDGFSLEAVLGEINSRGAGVKIALLDASRRNPYERRFRSFSAGLAPVVAPNGTLVMYSAAIGSVVPDNGGDHSLFVQELLKEIRVPDLPAEETLNRTRLGVTRASRGEQVPSVSSSLADDFSFVGRASGPVATLPQPNPVPLPRYDPLPPKVDPLPPRADIPVPLNDKPVPFNDKPIPLNDKPLDNNFNNNNNNNNDGTGLADDPTIKTLTAKLNDNPDDASTLYRRGQVYASKGAYNLAIRDFDDSIRINPRDVEAYNNRCWARTVVGDLQAALRDCNEALRLRPNFVDALDSRGLVNLKSGQTKNAIADFDAALRINPRLTSSLYGRGLAKQRNGSISEGDLDINNAKAMDPNIVKEFEGYGVR
jgi:hypothetical protein